LLIPFYALAHLFTFCLLKRLSVEEIRAAQSFNNFCAKETEKLMYRKMVICVTEATPEEVVRVASKLCDKETEVIVLHVVRVLTDLQRREAEEKFAWVIETLKKEGIQARLELVESADPKSAIVSFVRENSADVVVTGTIQKKGILALVSESISDYLIKHVPCTLVLVKRPD